MAESSTTGLVFDGRYRAHHTGDAHPESPARYDALESALRESGLLDMLTRIAPREASEDELLRVHTLEYLRVVRADMAAGCRMLSTGDTPLGPRSLETALLAAGGAVSAVDAVMQGTVRNAFAAVRPPGHHATAQRGMGFCIFNNVAVAARHAQRAHGVERVLIVDWDVHHGNGTQDIFYEDSSVLFFSTHQWPWYPGTGAANETGAGDGEGYTLNCPMAAGAGGAEILGAFRRRLLPAAETFKPDLVLISAGFDSRKGDPLGRLQLQDKDFVTMTGMLLDVASRHGSGRVVSVLEGGYSLEGLAKAAVAHISALAQAS